MLSRTYHSHHGYQAAVGARRAGVKIAAMKILILGAGQTGGSLAQHLANEAFDITLVDHHEQRLKDLKDRLDIRTIHGHASRPDTLLIAGADDVDMLVAVTNSDEVNMVACQVCYSLFQTPMKIARIRSNEYVTGPDGGDADIEFFSRDHMPIDVLINPERVVMEQIKELLEHPGALQVLDFADGRVQLVAVRAVSGGSLVGQELRALRAHMPNVHTKVVAIFRQGQAISPQDETVVEVNDEVFFIAPEQHINAVLSELRQVERPNRRVMIAGGGHVGLLLARAIDEDFRVRVVEVSPAQAERAAARLKNGVVILGDATERDLLIAENIEDTDVFCSVTNDDEVNIMSALLAKRLGARRVMALITKPDYVDLVEGGEIDIAISPQLATTSSILSHVRHADVTRVHSLRRGAAEAMEAVVNGDARNSKVADRRLDEIALPSGVTVGAVIRDEEVFVARGDIVLKAGDHVILFVVDKRRIRAVERLFQVGLGFF